MLNVKIFHCSEFVKTFLTVRFWEPKCQKCCGYKLCGRLIAKLPNLVNTVAVLGFIIYFWRKMKAFQPLEGRLRLFKIPFLEFKRYSDLSAVKGIIGG